MRPDANRCFVCGPGNPIGLRLHFHIDDQDVCRSEFTPGPDKAVEELASGENCITAIIWRVSDGRGVDDRSIPWCFDVV